MWLFCPHLECDYHVHTCTKEQRQWGNKRRRNTDELKQLCREEQAQIPSQCCLISGDDKHMKDIAVENSNIEMSDCSMCSRKALTV